jgi:hypothetical protein
MATTSRPPETPQTPKPPPAEGPYCNNCHYPLGGLTESSKCPECGGPLVEILRWPNQNMYGKRWRSRASILGMPVVDIAWGPSGKDKVGHPRGWIAIGDDAMGVLAIGGYTRGVVAIGGMSSGVFAAGGMAAGVLTAFGGMAASLGTAFGGLAIGSIASGGLAAGIVASGGMAYGVYARGGMAFGRHALSGGSQPQAERDAWAGIEWLVGAMPPTGPFDNLSMVIAATVSIGIALLIGLIAMVKLNSKPADDGAV